MIGCKFGRWTVLSEAAEAVYWSRGRRKLSRRWNVQCDCGTRRTVAQASLTSGRSASCGCFHDEQFAERNTRHGMVGTVEHRAWIAMRSRCSNPNENGWHRYGGRGISVCERWQSFENFYADMGPRPSRRHSLDRINNDGNYEPGNCRWAAPVVQCNNKSDNVRVDTADLVARYQAGDTTRVIAKAFGCSSATVRQRLLAAGVTLRDCAEYGRSITHCGETAPLSVFARRFGLHPMTVKWRLDHGWSVERALLTPSVQR